MSVHDVVTVCQPSPSPLKTAGPRLVVGVEHPGDLPPRKVEHGVDVLCFPGTPFDSHHVEIWVLVRHLVEALLDGNVLGVLYATMI